jgi:hypothetical protein
MIKLLAQLIRGFHYIIGISEPPPGASDRTFMFAWLGSIAFIRAPFVMLVYYIILFLLQALKEQNELFMTSAQVVWAMSRR